MISFADALQILRQIASQHRPCKMEQISLENAQGRILGEDILSPENVPAFANSAMDGFAVRASQTLQASVDHPISFPVIGSIAAGDAPLASSADGAFEIMTGAAVPEGFDAIVKIEDVRVQKNEKSQIISIQLSSPVSLKSHVRPAGGDFKQGVSVLSRGKKIGPAQILALASLGISQVQVIPRLRVLHISTGKELVPHEQTPGPGQIRNSTGPFFRAALENLGVEVVASESVPDDPEAFRQWVQKALDQKVDMILTTGAVSMGKYDFVSAEVQALGAQIYFHKVAIQPGKPLLFGAFPQGPVLFGVPGNPVSGVVALRFFIETYLREWQLQAPEKAWQARLTAPAKKPAGLKQLAKAYLQIQEGVARVDVMPGQMSFMVSPLLEANAWAILPEDTIEVAAGEMVEVYPLFSIS